MREEAELSGALQGRVIAISISESPDLARLGLGEVHLRDAMIEIARYLLAAGATLAYGGDLRPGGFTRALFELVRTYQQQNPDRAIPAVLNYLAFSRHAAQHPSQLAELEEALEGAGQLIRLSPDGSGYDAARGQSGEPDWSRDLTAMRRRMTKDCHARILLGGKVTGYKGRYPGVAEEAKLAIEKGVPAFLAGGFGGCTRDIIAATGLDRQAEWPVREGVAAGYHEVMEQIRGLISQRGGFEALNNGLGEKNLALFRTSSVPEIVQLILGGLLGGLWVRARGETMAH